MPDHEYKNLEVDHELLEHERDAWKARALSLTIYADQLRDGIRSCWSGTRELDDLEAFCRVEHERKVHLMPGAEWPVVKV